MDWNAFATVFCCVLTLILGALGVVIWAQLKEAVKKSQVNSERIASFETEIANAKTQRGYDAQENNRRFDEIKDHLNRIEKMLGQVLMHRRGSDQG